jgi:hypothetical protein
MESAIRGVLETEVVYVRKDLKACNAIDVVLHGLVPIALQYVRPIVAWAHRVMAE